MGDVYVGVLFGAFGAGFNGFIAWLLADAVNNEVPEQSMNTDIQRAPLAIRLVLAALSISVAAMLMVAALAIQEAAAADLLPTPTIAAAVAGR